MKLFKSSILAVLALGAALTSCNETSDVTYVPGAQDPGAFFAADIETAILVAKDATSAEIQINRTSDLITEANITAVDESKLFTIPGTVVFDEGKGSTPLTITFDPNKLEIDKPYTIKLSIADASTYGQGTCEFTITRGAGVVTEKFEQGTAIYVEDGEVYWNAMELEVAVSKTYNPSDPTKNVAIKVYDGSSEGPALYPTGATLDIQCPDFTPDADGNVAVFVAPIYINESETYGHVYYADIYSYCMAVPGASDNPEKYKNMSTYNVNTGVFSLYMVAYCSEGIFGDGYEYVNMDGFPVYDVAVSYEGYLTKADGSYQAVAKIKSGKDAATVRAAVVAGEDPQALVNVLLGSDDSKYVEFEGGSEKEVRLSFDGAGKYLIGAVTFNSKGEAQKANYAAFEVVLSGDDADWKSVGNADFGDGWILASYLPEGKTIMDFLYAVELQQNKENSNLYRLVQPWGSASPIADYNTNPRKRNLEFTIGDMISIAPQETGFKDEQGDYSIGNYEGILRSNNPDVSDASILAYMEQKGMEATTIVNDEDAGTYIEVPVCLFDPNGSGWYNWKSNPHGYIFMPDATSAVKAKVTSRNIARPNKGSMLKSVKARRYNKFNNNVKIGHQSVLRNHLAPYTLKK